MTTSTETIYQELKDRVPSPSGRPEKQTPYPASDGRIWGFCPVHPDGSKHGNRSLSLHPQYGLKCFAGCDFKTIKAALVGSTIVTHTPDTKERPVASLGTPMAIYQYSSANGTLIAEKGRWETNTGKTFRWRLAEQKHWSGLKNLTESELPLYRADALKTITKNTPIYFLEGEKAVDACVREGIQATCLAGGASTSDYGDIFEVLRDQVVILWPDNDAVGRSLMTRIRSHIREVAKSVMWINLPRSLPAKGDAYDYFQIGGSKKELDSNVLIEPVVEHLDRDAIRVTHPASGVPFVFTCSRIDKRRSVFECEFSVGPRGNQDPYIQRLNLLSSSGVTDVRRTLGEIYGKEHDWPKLLASVISLVRSTFVSADRSFDVADIEAANAELDLVPQLLPLNAPTMLFGDGGSAKSYFALSLAVGMATGHNVAGFDLPPVRTLYVDYEDNKQNFARRINRVCQGLDVTLPNKSIYYWPANGTPLADLADTIRDKVLTDDVQFLVIDSASTAVSGPIEDSSSTTEFFGALSTIGTTTLIIAHISKGPSDAMPTKPFGSAMWHNEARRTWSIKREQDEEADIVDVLLQNHKTNDSRKPKPISLQVKSLPLEQQIKLQIQSANQALMTSQEIADNLDILQNKVYYCLNSHKKLFIKTGLQRETEGRPADLWGLVSSEEVN